MAQEIVNHEHGLRTKEQQSYYWALFKKIQHWPYGVGLILTMWYGC
jgi:hypothetical protein